MKKTETELEEEEEEELSIESFDDSINRDFCHLDEEIQQDMNVIHLQDEHLLRHLLEHEQTCRRVLNTISEFRNEKFKNIFDSYEETEQQHEQNKEDNEEILVDPTFETVVASDDYEKISNQVFSLNQQPSFNNIFEFPQQQQQSISSSSSSSSVCFLRRPLLGRSRLSAEIERAVRLATRAMMLNFFAEDLAKKQQTIQALDETEGSSSSSSSSAIDFFELSKSLHNEEGDEFKIMSMNAFFEN